MTKTDDNAGISHDSKSTLISKISELKNHFIGEKRSSISDETRASQFYDQLQESTRIERNSMAQRLSENKEKKVADTNLQQQKTIDFQNNLPMIDIVAEKLNTTSQKCARENDAFQIREQQRSHELIELQTITEMLSHNSALFQNLRENVIQDNEREEEILFGNTSLLHINTFPVQKPSAKGSMTISFLQLQSKISTNIKSVRNLQNPSDLASGSINRVLELINGMVAKLENEAKEDSSWNSFCKTEKPKAEELVEKESLKTAELQARFDTVKSKIKKLRKVSIPEYESKIEKFHTILDESTNARMENKNQNMIFWRNAKIEKEALLRGRTMINQMYEVSAGIASSNGVKGSFLQKSKLNKYQIKNRTRKNKADAVLQIIANLEAEVTNDIKQYEKQEKEQSSDFQTARTQALTDIATFETRLNNAIDDLENVKKPLKRQYKQDLKQQEELEKQVRETTNEVINSCNLANSPGAKSEETVDLQEQISSLRNTLELLKAQQGA